jgi:hypothetical protein
MTGAVLSNVLMFTSAFLPLESGRRLDGLYGRFAGMLMYHRNAGFSFDGGGVFTDLWDGRSLLSIPGYDGCATGAPLIAAVPAAAGVSRPLCTLSSACQVRPDSKRTRVLP